MKIDLYTKAVLTVIAIGVGFLVFEQKPVKEAYASSSGSDTISAGKTSGQYQLHGVYHLQNGKIRFCRARTQVQDPVIIRTFCGEWNKEN